MGKKTFSASGGLRVVQFIPPRLVKAIQGWYVIFYTPHPVTQDLQRHRISYNLGRIKKKRDRQARADAIMEAIEELLPVGYPWIGGDTVYEVDRFIALHRKMQAATASYKAEKSVLECLLFVTDVKCQSDRYDTVRTYRNASVRIQEFLKQNGLEHLPVTQFGPQHAMSYLDSVRIRVGNNTYNNYRGQAIVLFNAMRDRGMIEDNPFLATKKVPAKKKGRRPFSPEEAAVVLTHLYETDYWLFMLVLLHLGEWCRKTEAHRLRFDRFNLRDGLLMMTDEDTKNRKESVVTIPREFLPFFLDERFTRWPTNYLLFGAGGQPHPSRPAGYGTLRRRHRIALQRLHDQGMLHDITGLTLYSWKDTGMTWMSQHLTPFQLRDHARHHSLDVSLRYYHGQKIIPEIRDAHLPFLQDAIEKQKERLKNSRSGG